MEYNLVCGGCVCGVNMGQLGNIVGQLRNIVVQCKMLAP